MTPYFEWYRDAEKLYRWRLRATNRLIIASGEGYHLRADCMRAINILMETTKDTPIKFLEKAP